MQLFNLAPGEARLWLRGQFASGKTIAPIRELPPLERMLVPAAVLVPLVLRDSGVTVLLTRRAEHLQDHPGQISFPGGRCEPMDQSAADTALREACEEVGLSPAAVEVLGELPRYPTGTGFLVSPVVGVMMPPFEISLDENEVQEVFEVPLSFLLGPLNHQKHGLEAGGQLREYDAMRYRDYFIWGATAGMLVMLREYLLA